MYTLEQTKTIAWQASIVIDGEPEHLFQDLMEEAEINFEHDIIEDKGRNADCYYFNDGSRLISRNGVYRII